MLAKTFTATIHGLDPIKIEVEVDSHRGIPNLIIIGLPTKAVQESKERITAALNNCRVRIRSRRTIVNLAPAAIKKSSPAFDLAIIVSLLKMYQEIKINTDDTIFFGELSLDGHLKPIKGTLPLVLAAKKMGFKKVIIPQSNREEVSTIKGIRIFPINHLQDYLNFAQRKRNLPALKPKKFLTESQSRQQSQPDFKDIYYQQEAKRALLIAATGGHNLLMIGPPGSGKSLLAKTMTSILPPLSETEAMEVTSLYSLYSPQNKKLITQRPFRQPHHSISYAGLIGGGSSLKPGEISLAHRGVLFLDELTEFDRYSLESLRQPLEDKSITLVRAHSAITYPASFILIAAANPCPCGWYGSHQKPCRCSQHARQQYQRKFSGPLLDRIDLLVKVQPLDLRLLQKTKIKQTSSIQIKKKIMRAQKFQQPFLEKFKCQNVADLSSKIIKKHVKLTPASQRLLTKATQNFQLTTRGYFRVIKVALTIAHLDSSYEIQPMHLAEALQYRIQQSQY